MTPVDILSPKHQAAWRADLSAIPLNARLEKEAYEDALEEVQEHLMIRHNALMAEKRRAIIVFEGWDAAGKGGAIKRLTANWDPRGYKVWPIAAPDAHERARHYLYRFWKRLPRDGEIGIFDRSWYGRVLVERVEGFCTKDAWQRAYDEINAFEETLIENGSSVIKFFLHVDADEQEKRFRDRLHVPHKRWKITEEDFRNREQRKAYTHAIQDMLAKTHTKRAPWRIIPATQKKFARVAVLNAVEHWLDGMKLDLDPPLRSELSKYLNSL